MWHSGRDQRILKRRRELTASTMPNSPRQPKQVTQADQEIGRKVRTLRRASGMAIIEAAAALGISWQQMHKYETGLSRIGISRLQAIANLFGVSVSTLLEEDAERVAGRSALKLLETPGASELLQLYLSASDEAARRSILALVVAAADLKA
ncbi:helix-turn-helix domain-containing protein [Methylobacterium gregans]|nr:helix-turn-helix domain-containing protein [Methylobacterium gregans]